MATSADETAKGVDMTEKKPVPAPPKPKPQFTLADMGVTHQQMEKG